METRADVVTTAEDNGEFEIYMARAQVASRAATWNALQEEYSKEKCQFNNCMMFYMQSVYGHTCAQATWLNGAIASARILADLRRRMDLHTLHNELSAARIRLAQINNSTDTGLYINQAVDAEERAKRADRRFEDAMRQLAAKDSRLGVLTIDVETLRTENKLLCAENEDLRTKLDAMKPTDIPGYDDMAEAHNIPRAEEVFEQLNDLLDHAGIAPGTLINRMRMATNELRNLRDAKVKAQPLAPFDFNYDGA